MMDETPDKRRINDDPVAPPPALVPARSVLTGSMVRLEPIDPARHAAVLYRVGHTTEAARNSWAFLPWGPFPSEAAMHAQLRDFAASLDRVFYAICDQTTGDAVGVATYLDIQPASGVIEIGGIWFAPGLRTQDGRNRSTVPAACIRDRRSRLQAHAMALQRAQRKEPRSRPAPWLSVRGYLVQPHDCQRAEPRYCVVLDP